MVASNQGLATSAGLSVLRAGGSAADAAVAVAAVLQVTEPYATGLGGDAFWMYYNASTGAVEGYNGSGCAPAALSFERASRVARLVHGRLRIPGDHPYAVTVPGAPEAWERLLHRHGRLAPTTVVADAVDLARHGFPVAPVTAWLWRTRGASVLGEVHGGLRIDQGPSAGQIVRLPELADALETFGELGAGPFYVGERARRIVAAVARAGGVLSVEDLAHHSGVAVTPVALPYRGATVYELPPNGQGVVALMALNILSHSRYGDYAVAAAGGDEAAAVRALHMQIESVRIAFDVASRYLADPSYQLVSVDEMLSHDRAASYGGRIDGTRYPLPPITEEAPFGEGSDTVYFCTADGEGNICSFINSNYTAFGSGIVVADGGYALQNRGACFTVEPDHPNAPAPGKRPYHTIIPGMMRTGGDVTAFGVMGGYMQPQGHVQVVSSLVDAHRDPQTALDRPRFYVENGTPNGRVLLEDAAGAAAGEGLTRLGHRVVSVSGRERSVFGLGQIIHRRDGVYVAGSDPRGDGVALGF